MIAYKLAFLSIFAVHTFALDIHSSVAAPVTTTEGFENEEEAAADTTNTSTSKVCFTLIYFLTR